PEIAFVSGCAAGDSLTHLKKAAHAVACPHAVFDPPGHHDLVAGVLVYLPFGLKYRFRQIVHATSEQLEVAGASQSFGKLRRTLEIEEQKDAPFGRRPVVNAREEISQHVGADHAVHLNDELDRDGQDGEEWQCVDQVTLGEARHETLRLEAGHYLPERPTREVEHEQQNAAHCQICPETDLSKPGTRPAIAEEDQIPADEQRNQHGIDQPLNCGPHRGFAAHDIEDRQ